MEATAHDLAREILDDRTASWRYSSNVRELARLVLADTEVDGAAAKRDAELLERTLGDEASNALAVFVTDPLLRSVLDRLDPKAVEQARDALGLPPVT